MQERLTGPDGEEVRQYTCEGCNEWSNMYVNCLTYASEPNPEHGELEEFIVIQMTCMSCGATNIQFDPV